MKSQEHIQISFKGPGFPDLRMVKIEFDVVYDKGNTQLPDDFYWNK